MTTTTAPVFMLKGDALIEFCKEKMELINRNEMTRTEMILDAGYVYDYISNNDQVNAYLNALNK